MNHLLIGKGGTFRPITKQDIANLMFRGSMDAYTYFRYPNLSQVYAICVNKIEREDGSGSSFNLYGTDPDGEPSVVYVRTID